MRNEIDSAYRYFQHVESLVSYAIECWLEGDQGVDEFTDVLWEHVDSACIYTHDCENYLRFSPNDNAYFEEYGVLESVDSWSDVVTKCGFAALYADCCERLSTEVEELDPFANAVLVTASAHGQYQMDNVMLSVGEILGGEDRILEIGGMFGSCGKIDVDRIIENYRGGLGQDDDVDPDDACETYDELTELVLGSGLVVGIPDLSEYAVFATVSDANCAIRIMELKDKYQ